MRPLRWQAWVLLVAPLASCGSQTENAWSADASGTSNDLLDVWGSGPSDAWVVGATGAGGTIFHWNGTAWSASSPVTSQKMFGVWGSAPNDVWAVGARGTIVHHP
jgi:hypothetical protein